MVSLFIDTSADGLSLAAKEDSKVLFCRHGEEKKEVAEAILPTIISSLKEAGVAFTAIDKLFVTTGPGSYTGERIGLTVSKVYALLSPKAEVYTASTLQVMSSAVKGVSVCVLDARNQACFCGVFDNGKLEGEEARKEKDEIASILASHSSASLVCLASFASELQARYPGAKVVPIKMEEALLDAESAFVRQEDPMKMKASYLRGRQE